MDCFSAREIGTTHAPYRLCTQQQKPPHGGFCMPVEEQHFIHNMSAPPRSKIAIGSHRKDREIVSVQLDRLPDEQENWDRVLALQYGYNSPDAFIQAADQHLHTLSPPAVAVKSKGAK